MTGKFLFRFGYCTPLQWKGNEANGWDDEASAAFIVVAESEAAALEIGVNVVETAVADLFASQGWSRPTPSWREADFAHWVEPVSAGSLPEEQLGSLPVVTRNNSFPADEILGLNRPH